MDVRDPSCRVRKTFLDLNTFQHTLAKKYKNIPQSPLDKDDEKALEPKLL
jgi:hypothetical protein